MTSLLFTSGGRRGLRSLIVLSIAGLLSVATASSSGAESSHAVPVNLVTSGPGAQFYGYVAPVVVTEKGGSLVYANLDIARHDVVQDPKTDGVAGPQKKPWCKLFKKGACPVFWSPSIGLGQQAEVLGLESVKPGKTYSFYCTLHPGMRGTLVARP